QWWLTSHVRRYHKRHVTSGHVWQGRFKSFPIQEDAHLLTVLRYVLRNPCRAGLAAEPWDWRWSSLRFARMIAPWPVDPVHEMGEWLSSAPITADEDEVTHAIRRSSPFGDDAWREAFARAWGLDSTVQPLGRPRVELGLPGETEPVVH